MLRHSNAYVYIYIFIYTKPQLQRLTFHYSSKEMFLKAAVLHQQLYSPLSYRLFFFLKNQILVQYSKNTFPEITFLTLDSLKKSRRIWWHCSCLAWTASISLNCLSILIEKNLNCSLYANMSVLTTVVNAGISKKDERVKCQ